MARVGICGGSSPAISPIIDGERSRNFFPELQRSPNAKTAMGMLGTPGKKKFCVLPEGPLRGELEINGRAFAIGGTKFCEIFTDGTVTVRGTISYALDRQPATLAASNLQVLMTSNGRAYYFTLATNAFAEIDTTSGNGIPGPVSMCGYSDGYGLLLCSQAPNKQRFQISNPLNFAIWQPAQFGDVSVYPDDVVSMLVDHREIWLFGRKASVPYYNSGNANFPFSPVLSGFNEIGTTSLLGRAKADNTIFLMVQSDAGEGMAYRIEGYRPVRISDHGIEYIWQSYPNKTSDVVTYTYQEAGHTFWACFFPSANNGSGATWVFDLSTELWHERESEITGAKTADVAWMHTYAFQKHLVGSWVDGTIYDQSLAYLDDDGTPIQRERISGPITAESSLLQFDALIADLEVGLGTMPPLENGDGTARGPLLMLSWSDDGGKTWSPEFMLDCGQAGNFRNEVKRTRLGTSRNRVFKLRCSDAVPWRFADIYVTGPDLPRQARLAHRLREQN